MDETNEDKRSAADIEIKDDGKKRRGRKVTGAPAVDADDPKAVRAEVAPLASRLIDCDLTAADAQPDHCYYTQRGIKVRIDGAPIREARYACGTSVKYHARGFARMLVAGFLPGDTPLFNTRPADAVADDVDPDDPGALLEDPVAAPAAPTSNPHAEAAIATVADALGVEPEVVAAALEAPEPTDAVFGAGPDAEHAANTVTYGHDAADRMRSDAAPVEATADLTQSPIVAIAAVGEPAVPVVIHSAAELEAAFPPAPAPDPALTNGPVDPRIPAPGTALRGRYMKQDVLATMLEEGKVRLDATGEVYTSLSSAATAACGSRRNGYQFFGL